MRAFQRASVTVRFLPPGWETGATVGRMPAATMPPGLKKRGYRRKEVQWRLAGISLAQG